MTSKKLFAFKAVSFLVFSLILPTCVLAGKPLSLYFSPYYDEDSKKVGVQYGDDICVMPLYDDVDMTYVPSFPRNFKNLRGYFAYKQDGKWGISCIYGPTSEPKFDRIRFFADSNIPSAIVLDNGKEGLVDFAGNEVMPCSFDSITCKLELRYDLSYHRVGLTFYNEYFLAYDNGIPMVIDMLGNVVSDNCDVSKILSQDTKSRKKVYKAIVSSENKRGKKNPQLLSEIKEKRKSYWDNFIQGNTGISAKVGEESNKGAIYKDLNNNKFLIIGDRMWKLPPEYDYELYRTWRTIQGARKTESGDTLSFLKIYKDGKYGVIDLSGKIIIPIGEYDKISWVKEYDVIGENCFQVIKNGFTGRISANGDEIIPCIYESINIEWDEYDRLVYGKIGKNKHYYWENIKLAENNKKAAYKKKYEITGGITAVLKPIGKGNTPAIPIFELACYPYVRDGYESTITDNGTDLTALAKCSSAEIAQRKGTRSFVAEAREFYEKKSFQLQDYGYLCELVSIAEQSGYECSDFIKDVKGQIEWLERSYYYAEQRRIEYEKQRIEQEERERFNAKVNMVNSAIQNLLNIGMNAYTTINGNSGSTINTTQDHSVPTNKSRNHSTNNNLSEQQSYNSDKSVYNKYDNILSAVFAGNRKAKASEISEWQNKMKQLRKKWEAKGKSFPHSSNEDR